jgi:hypothetical protein
VSAFHVLSDAEVSEAQEAGFANSDSDCRLCGTKHHFAAVAPMAAIENRNWQKKVVFA